MDDLELKPSAYVLLGMIRSGLTSGYAIKQAIEHMRITAFWATSFAQIYPELANLEAKGCLTRREDPHGNRARSAYALTERGLEAFISWLGSPDPPVMELRDEGLLRLAFADNLSTENQLALLERLRERCQDEERMFREYNVPMSEALRAETGWRYPTVVSRMGAEYNAWAAGFFARLETELREIARQAPPVRSGGDPKAAARKLSGPMQP